MGPTWELKPREIKSWGNSKTCFRGGCWQSWHQWVLPLRSLSQPLICLWWASGADGRTLCGVPRRHHARTGKKVTFGAPGPWNCGTFPVLYTIKQSGFLIRKETKWSQLFLVYCFVLSASNIISPKVYRNYLAFEYLFPKSTSKSKILEEWAKLSIAE